MHRSKVNIDSDATTGGDGRCVRCASLDIDAILLSRPKTYRGKLILKLGFNGKQKTDFSCSFCRLLAAIAPPSISNLDDLALYAFSLQGRLWSYKDETVVLAVLRMSDTKGKGSRDRIEESLSRTGYVALTTPPKFISNSETMRGRVIDPQKVDYAIIRNWIRHCESTHKAPCSEKGSRQFNFLKLINCSTRRLEQLSHPCAYLALSYVWGQVAQTESNLQLRLPKTVEDAITVTESLGYKYLWVDKYCMDQTDAKAKKDQIRQMDLVYLNAELTIVAGAGHNSDAGLPGVSSVLWTGQAKAQVGKHIFVSLMSDPKRVIMDSPWISRGWTFQEAFFSRRLLIFTHQQVYFECRSTNFCESVNMTRDWTGWNIFSSDSERRRCSWHILERLAEYSERKLTYQDDILNAILGVLTSYE
ncbi:HET-domain-containing protein, partial [Lepidopterella palustris CBS 459.81]